MITILFSVTVKAEHQAEFEVMASHLARLRSGTWPAR